MPTVRMSLSLVIGRKQGIEVPARYQPLQFRMPLPSGLCSAVGVLS